MPKQLTSCVKKVKRQGKDESSAYAICSTSTGWKRAKGKKWKNEKTGKVFNENLTFEEFVHSQQLDTNSRIQSLLPIFRRYVTQYGKSSGITKFALEHLNLNVNNLSITQRQQLITNIKHFQNRSSGIAESIEKDDSITILGALIGIVFKNTGKAI